MNDSLRLHVEKIKKLPTLPVIAQEILALIGDDVVTVNKLAKIIESDPAISARILSVANSAFFGFREPARTLNIAIFRIGFDNVKNIALGISVMTVLDGGKRQGALHYQRIFNHSVAVGFTAKLLSGLFKLSSPDEILICGLLHDIGLLVLSGYFSDSYLKVLNGLEREKMLSDVEKDVFGFTHADIGCWLAEKWSLPDTVSDAILYHHSPHLARRNLRHVAAVHIADYLAGFYIIKSIAYDYNPVFDHSCLDMLGLSEDDLNDVTEKLKSGSLFSGLFTIS